MLKCARYADATCSMEPVTSGYRVILLYNLVAKSWQPLPSLRTLQNHMDRVRHTLSRWKRLGSSSFLVYRLRHPYTDASFRVSDLRGADVHRVQCLMHMRQQLGVELFLGSLEKSIEGPWQDMGETINYWRRKRSEHDEDVDDDDDYDDSLHVITEEYSSSLTLLSVMDLEGNPVVRNMGVRDKHMVQSEHDLDRLPDHEDFEECGYGENAMVTHRYLVSRAQHFCLS